MKHDYNDLICIFNQCFEQSHNTVLQLGGDEPIYYPASRQHPQHRIIFARGFFASALHEIAHWCVAGEARRLLEDYGYWYQPDGRSAEVQAEFEKVEIRPQAFEWILSASCNFQFRVSCDNLQGDFEPDRAVFTEKVRLQALELLEQGLPERLRLLSEHLCTFYQRTQVNAMDFQRASW